MKQIAADLLAWRERGDAVAIATVVRVAGSAPRPVGATLLAAAGARLSGSVSNGCVEADVYEAAMAALASGQARVVRYGISDEFAFTVGLSCGGQIDVLVEPVNALHESVAAALGDGSSAVLASVLSPGARLGTKAAWIDGTLVDGSDRTLARLASDAERALRSGASRIVGAEDRRIEGAENGGGAAAEATEEVFLEALAGPALLAIVGASDVAMALSRLASVLGFRVVVCDPRAALANRERFGEEIELANDWPDEALARLRLDPTAAIVVLSHDEKFDHPALTAALRSRAGYIGAIGSRRTNEQRFAWLRAQGFGDADIARVHAPIGLDVGAKSAEETALAILAEIVAVRRGRSGGMLSASTHGPATTEAAPRAAAAR